jgi:hypothetical protein
MHALASVSWYALTCGRGCTSTCVRVYISGFEMVLQSGVYAVPSGAREPGKRVSAVGTPRSSPWAQEGVSHRMTGVKAVHATTSPAPTASLCAGTLSDGPRLPDSSLSPATLAHTLEEGEGEQCVCVCVCVCKRGCRWVRACALLRVSACTCFYVGVQMGYAHDHEGGAACTAAGCRQAL